MSFVVVLPSRARSESSAPSRVRFFGAGRAAWLSWEEAACDGEGEAGDVEGVSMQWGACCHSQKMYLDLGEHSMQCMNMRERVFCFSVFRKPGGYQRCSSEIPCYLYFSPLFGNDIMSLQSIL